MSTTSAAPIVVGVDGSPAAVRAAEWAVVNVVPSRIRELVPEDVDRRVAECLAGHPEVQARVALASGEVAAFLAACDPPVQLAVVGSHRGDGVTDLIGTYGRMVLRDTTCSVLLLDR